MATRAIRLPVGDGGETSYTLQPGESFKLVSVVGSLTAFKVGAALVPTLTVAAPDGSVIAEVATAAVTV